LAIFSISKLERVCNERIDTLNSGIFMIHLFFNDDFFCSSDAVQNVRLVVIISIYTSAKKLFLRVRVLLECFRKSKNMIRGSCL